MESQMEWRFVYSTRKHGGVLNTSMFWTEPTERNRFSQQPIPYTTTPPHPYPPYFSLRVYEDRELWPFHWNWSNGFSLWDLQNSHSVMVVSYTFDLLPRDSTISPRVLLTRPWSTQVIWDHRRGLLVNYSLTVREYLLNIKFLQKKKSREWR